MIGDIAAFGSNAAVFKSGYAPVNGLRMYYETGSGRPLVLLHGGGSTIETSFGRILPLLAQGRQVIGFEHSGHESLEVRLSKSKGAAHSYEGKGTRMRKFVDCRIGDLQSLRNFSDPQKPFGWTGQKAKRGCTHRCTFLMRN